MDIGLWNNTLIVTHADNGGPIYFSGCCGGCETRAHLLRRHFLLTNDQFTKTGSGQTSRKLKKGCVFRRNNYPLKGGKLSNWCETRISDPFFRSKKRFRIRFFDLKIDDDEFIKTGSTQMQRRREKEERCAAGRAGYVQTRLRR